jgi:hypothetical protein
VDPSRSGADEVGRYSPTTASAYVMTAGTPMLALWVFATEGPLPVRLTALT